MANEKKRLDYGSVKMMHRDGCEKSCASQRSLDIRSLSVYQVVIDAAARPKELDTPEAIARRGALSVLDGHLHRMRMKHEWAEAMSDCGWRGDGIGLAISMRNPGVSESDILKAIAVLRDAPATKVPEGWYVYDGSAAVLKGLAECSEHGSVREAAKGALSAWNEQAVKTLVDFASKMTLSDVFAARFPCDPDAIVDAIKKLDDKNIRARAILTEIAGIERVERLMPKVMWAAKAALWESQ